MTKPKFAAAMSKFLFFACCILALPTPAFAQSAYFQQEVAYRINVTLDDRAHTLKGTVEIDYKNNAPVALTEFWMHLWGNAFKNRQSAFCRQKLEAGDAKFYFAPDSALGYYTGLDFQIDGKKAHWEFDRKNPDIALIRLETPLPPGGRITISSPFVLKIPDSFSRLGHVGTSYQLTQWYPKPAVYDARGWHPMPYLDQGEFYSEFGNYDVTIALPANYIVGATGVLQTPSEREFLVQKDAETRAALPEWTEESKTKGKKSKLSFPPSSTELKTLHYTAENVHDFAWFADKRFHVLRDTARLASGRQVECWAMFPDGQRKYWSRGAFYVKRAVEFYSETVGEYPWPQATAVHSALSAGGGMEYPMITVIGNSSSDAGLDEVITHEVGHNWFYGILASNERDHPWMDEGINSYYEQRYMRRFYGGGTLTKLEIPKRLYNPAQQGSPTELGYLFLAREHRDTPPDSPSDAFTQVAYGLQVYMKTALCLRWVQESTGTERFDRAMQDYYRKWKFRHPYPEDLEQSWRDSGLEADWFFETMCTRKQADVALSAGVKTEGDNYEIKVRNKGDLAAPFPVSAVKDGKTLNTKWYPPLQSGNATVVLESPEKPDAFVIDAEHHTLDVNRSNNTLLLKNRFPFGLKAVNLLQNPEKIQLGIFPWAGWNHYDKAIIGLLLYNAPLPPRRFQYYLAPGIGTGSGRPAGMFDIRYKLYPDGWLSRITLGLSGKSYDFDYNWRDDYYSRFYRLQPKIRADLGSRWKTYQHTLQYRVLFTGSEEGIYEPVFTGNTRFEKSVIHELRYEAGELKLPNPYQASLAFEYQGYDDLSGARQHYLKGSLEWQQRIYYKAKRIITARFFAGYFLDNTRRNSTTYANALSRGSFALNPQGFNDYRYDQIFLGRSETSGILSRQVSQTEGGFKSAFGMPYADQAGNSNDYILALNLKADLPLRLPLGIPLRPYFDAGLYDATAFRTKSETLLWSGGFMLEFFKGGFEVYFPLLHSKNLRDLHCQYTGGDPDKPFCGNYWRWVSWSIKINTVEPVEILEKLVR